MIKTLRLIAALILLANLSFGQASQSGEIYGRVSDEKKQPLDFATVTAFEGGLVKGGGKTDLNGNFLIKPLAPGKYNLRITYGGYQTQEISGITVGSDKRTEVNVSMEKKVTSAISGDKEIKVTAYKNPLIDKNDAGRKAMDSKEIKTMANNNNVAGLVGLQSGTYQKKEGSELSIGGDRSSGTLFMIDGIPVRSGRNGTNIPTNSIDNLELIGNGMSAKYGNATGGVIGITTRGIQRDFGGGVQLQHSVEGYNNNLVTANIAGPLYSKTKNGTKRPIIGFSLNGSFTYDKDNNPSSYKNYALTDEARKRVQANPLIANPTGAFNFVRAAEALTPSDFKQIKARDNVKSWGTNLIGKLDFQASENLSFTLFSNFSYNNARTSSWSDLRNVNSLLSPEANPLTTNYTSRSYVRMTQKLGKSASEMKQDDKKSAVSNAYYSLQFIYQKDYDNSYNPIHKDNIFNYGYLGKFKTHRTPSYRLETVEGGYRGIEFQGDNTDSITFTPAGINPILENYSKPIFDDNRFDVPSLSILQALGGLRNGDPVQDAYGSMWNGVGNQINTFSYNNADQVNVNLEASFDIEQGGKNVKRKDPIIHNIQFGLGYEQRTSRRYALAPANLWSIMRLNTNGQFAELDTKNPHFVIGGQTYSLDDLNNGVVVMSQFDSVKYDPLYTASNHSRFDKELRKKLNLEDGELNTTTIDIDNLDPSTFSLEMFEADDLLNQGNDAVSYYGYDYLGNKLAKQPSFNDFWTKKDTRGDFTRSIGAFRPIYMYGYILDKFSYKDLNFNIGVRLDRWDANTKVLKDKYSLYGIRKNGDIKDGTYQAAISTTDGSVAPKVSTFPSDYVPYIDNNQSTIPTVVGYRKDDTWYDPYGKEISDPTLLSGLYAGGNPIQPWLIDKSDDIKKETYKVDNAFEDYTPQVTLSPRVKFSFPISEEALFYGNYDVISQQPSNANLVTPDDYYFLRERQQTINNGNLKMEKAVNYSLGYQQKLSPKSALTIEAYYRERRNQIQVQQILLAYPITYKTYGNRDFSSTTGTTVSLDFRRSGPLQVKFDYTLQFAEGTGSSSTSQNSLIASGQPNLRTVFPLNNDARHTFNARFDYRYDDDKNKGPKIGKGYPFQNAGVNLILRSRSGEPYTRNTLATALVGGDFNSTPILGGINGSRLPWNYEMNLRVDKTVTLGYYGAHKNKEGQVIGKSKPFNVNFYALVTNLLNTRNLLGVYGYTGSGNDDGYLTSPQGQQFTSSLQFKNSYEELYRIKLLNPDNFNNPRRINLGLSFDF